MELSVAASYVYKEWDKGFSRLYLHDTDEAVHKHWFTASMTPYLATVLCSFFVADAASERAPTVNRYTPTPN